MRTTQALWWPLITLLAAATQGCGPASVRSRHATPAELAAYFGGEDGLRLVRSAAVIDVYEVAGKSPATIPGTVEQVAGFRITGGPRRMAPDAARELSATLTDRGTYLPDVAKGCVFNADAAARFTGSDGATLVIVVCFGCNQMMIERDGVRTGFVDIDPGRERLRRALAAAFPGVTLGWASRDGN